MHFKKTNENIFLWYLNKNKTIKATIASIGLKMHLVLQPNEPLYCGVTTSAQGPKPAVDFQFDVGSPRRAQRNQRKTQRATQTPGGRQRHRKQTEEVAADAG